MIKLIEFLGKTNPLRKPYRGLVVDNNDPQKLQRVKCIIYGIMDGPLETLPWIYPKNPAGLGARSDVGTMMPPSTNTELVIEFPTEDIYAAFYTGTWQSADTHAAIFDEDYPATYGMRDDVGNQFRVNRLKGFSEWKAQSGARLRFEPDSTIELRSRKAVKLISEDGKTEFLFDLENGVVSLNPKQSMEVGGLAYLVNSQKVTMETGTYNQTVNGGKVTQVLGGNKLIVGGPSSESLVGDKNSTIAGDKSLLLAGKRDTTIGVGDNTTIVSGGESKKILEGDSELNMLLGDSILNILVGDIDYTTAAGKAEIKNLIGKMAISIAGAVELSNLIGKLSVDATGNIDVSNPGGGLKISPIGAITLKSLLNAEFSGLAQTKVGSSAGLTQVDGTIVSLGGPAGSPVARVGDISIGVGNLGGPVISTVIMGSFKVVAS